MPGSFIPPYNPDNVLTGVASMFVQDWVRGTDATTLLPADDIDLGGDWGVDWTPIGATDSGLEFQYSFKTNEIMIEEQVVEVDEVPESITFSMNVTMAEDTFETMRLAFGGGTITTVAAATGTPGTQQITLSSDLSRFVFAFEVQNEFGFWRRYLVPKVKSIADFKVKYARAKDKRMYDVSFKSLVAPEDVIIREKTAAAL